MDRAAAENDILKDCIFDGSILVTMNVIEPDVWSFFYFKGTENEKPARKIMVPPASENGVATQ